MEKIDLSNKIMRCFKCDEYNYVSRLSRGMGINIDTGKSLVKYEVLCVNCDGKGYGYGPDDANLGKTISITFLNDSDDNDINE